MKPRLHSWSAALICWWVGLSLASLLVGCGDDNPRRPASLKTPRSFAVARGPVCLGGPGRGVSACPDGQRGAIGLVANQTGDSVSVVDMSPAGADAAARRPKLVDLDPAVPGVTGIRVGDTPVDVAAGGGVGAYVVNQVDRSVSVVNLWKLATTEDPIYFDQAPIAARVVPAAQQGAADQVVVALSQPARLWVHPDVCTCPTGGPAQGCNPDQVQCQAPKQAAGAELSLPASVADMAVDPGGDRLYVVYQDAPFASVVALSADAVDAGADGCLDTDQPPCEVSRIGLGFGCSNGVDDDGDGMVDRDDPQCFGPRGAESPEGIGRLPMDICANGLDDDNDGDIDRDDPDCLVSGGSSESEPVVDGRRLACMDGLDNDGDGDADFPADAACYGASGRRESRPTATGYAAVATDPFGTFVYVADRAQNQVLVVDASAGTLVDAYDTGGDDRTAFSSQPGIAVPPSPTAIDGQINRRVVWRDPRPDKCGPDGPCRHAIVRYDYGVEVAADNGFAYNVGTLTSYCEVDAPAGDGIVEAGEFFAGSTALDQSAEAACLQTPSFPIDYDAAACRRDDACTTCRAAGGRGCEQVCADNEQDRQACFGDRVTRDGGVRLAYNPTFELVDSFGRQARVRGLGTCKTSETFVSALREVVDGPVDSDCSSPLRPQPVRPGTSDEAVEADDFERAGLFKVSEALLAGGDELDAAARAALDQSVDPFEVVALDLVEVDDQSAANEAWTVTWEGIIPGTRRDDAIVSEAGDGGVRLPGIDLCQAGVQPGDRLTIIDEPVAAGADELPEQCQVFVDDEQRQDFLSWSIDAVRPGEVDLQVISEPQGEQAHVDQLPTRGCFGQGVRFEIRAHDQWIVVGDQSGFLSNQTSVLGTCQPTYGADNPRSNGRVKTGDVFEGPYLSFRMRPGQIDARRGANDEMSYRFAVERNFRPDNVQTTALLPTQLGIETRLPDGPWLMVADPASDFIYFRDLSRSTPDAEFLLR